MFGLDNTSGVNVMPAIAPKSSDNPLWFTEGGSGLAATYPGQDWFNQVQAEMLNVLISAGVTPEKGKLNQLSLAIQQLCKTIYPLSQNTGASTSSVMSQKAVTEAISDSQVNVPDATTEVKGKTKLSNSVSNSESEAITPLAGKEIADGKYNSILPVMFVPNIVMDTTTNNRNAIYNYGKDVYIPLNTTIRCNLLPDDDVTIFKGEGKILTRDPWGNEHIFDVKKANYGSDFTALGLLHRYGRTGEECSVGVIGDSITDGAWSTSWSPNPINAAGNLSSTNHNHNLNGGKQSWFRVFTDNLNLLSNTEETPFKAFNCSSSGKKLFDGWGYRNFDYGFFQNTAYGNKAPKVLFVALGVNDNADIWKTGYEEYFARYEQIIRKAWGYGSTICFVSLNSNMADWGFLEGVIKKRLEREFLKVEYIDLSQTTFDMYTDLGNYNIIDISSRPNNVLDRTHFSTIGHQYIGAYAANMIFPGRVTKAVIAKNMVPTVNTSFYAFGYPSRVRYEPSLETLSGSDYLNKLGGWSVIKPASENVIIRYFIHVDENDISLSLFEPKISTYTTAARNNSFKCFLHSLSNAPYLSGMIASTNMANFEGKQVTNIGILKKGFNIIEITYDGNPTQVFPPALLFRQELTPVMSGNSVVILRKGDIKGLTNKAPVINDLLLGYSLQTVDDESPDMSSNTKQFQVNVVDIESMPVGAVILFNYKQNLKTGCGVGRVSATEMAFYTCADNQLTILKTETADMSRGVRVTKGGDKITFSPTSGAKIELDITGFTGGRCVATYVNEGSTTLLIDSTFSRL